MRILSLFLGMAFAVTAPHLYQSRLTFSALTMGPPENVRRSTWTVAI
jgi:hypothetical protein